ncbi:hypothetical protein F5Y01DRAFT_309753 [Xylaria sp. FL0043]|nr:hypothetical protein F5Y01DRAFT_309753 [Xylaria sp. FL0043]
MDPTRQQAGRLAKDHKRVHFSDDVDIRVISAHEPAGQHHEQRDERRHLAKSPRSILTVKDGEPELNCIPSLFRCTSPTQIRKVISQGHGSITETFRGYNALHWYCDAKSTSRAIILELLDLGIDINALDERPHTHSGPVIRHTALGYACRNANLEAMRILLSWGASPFGLERSNVPKTDVHGRILVYPSPLQELLCQPIQGPGGQRPWIYYLNKDHLNGIGGDLDDDDDSGELPEFRSLGRLSSAATFCQDCARNFQHVGEPSPMMTEVTPAREGRQADYQRQIKRLGKRLKLCVAVLLTHDCWGLPMSFARSDDIRLWPALDYLFATFWCFFSPLANSGRTSRHSTAAERLARLLSQPVFEPFGDVCDMLIESADYETEMWSAASGKRGPSRLLSLILEHPDRSVLMRGEAFHFDAMLNELPSSRLYERFAENTS